jgi:endonuclease YncB( thermonuclease family)
LAVYVRTHKDRTTFERLLGEVFAEMEPGELGNVGDALVEAGHATRPERR